jgi:hypothetical protein
MHPHPGKASMTDTFLHKILRKMRLVGRVLEHPRLSVLSKVVFAELLLQFHNNGDGRCDPPAETIGKRISRGERAVRVAIVELEQANLLRCRQQRRGGPEYIFPGLEDTLERDNQDRQVSADLGDQDRQDFAPRPAGIGVQDRQESADKPSKRTNQENHPSLRSGGTHHSKRVRISEKWQPSPEGREFALSRGFSASEIDDEVVLFRNHYIDKPGKTAKRLDWDRPFQDWIVRAGRWKSEASPKKRPADRAALDWDWHVDRYRTGGMWIPTLGPAPDHAGCKAPLEVLHRYGFGRTAGAA